MDEYSFYKLASGSSPGVVLQDIVCTCWFRIQYIRPLSSFDLLATEHEAQFRHEH